VYSKHLTDLFLEQIKVLDLWVDVGGGAFSVVIVKKGLNLRKSLVLYKRGDKGHTFLLGNTFSLEHEE
jgi:hypothetical protein